MGKERDKLKRPYRDFLWEISLGQNKTRSRAKNQYKMVRYSCSTSCIYCQHSFFFFIYGRYLELYIFFYLFYYFIPPFALGWARSTKRAWLASAFFGSYNYKLNASPLHHAQISSAAFVLFGIYCTMTNHKSFPPLKEDVMIWWFLVYCGLLRAEKECSRQ